MTALLRQPCQQIFRATMNEPAIGNDGQVLPGTRPVAATDMGNAGDRVPAPGNTAT
jgi:hypothetical protein